MIDLKYTNCPMGCRKGDKYITSGHDNLHGLKGEFEIVKCIVCGLMRTNPRPTRDSMSYYYPPSYDPHKIRNDNEAGKSVLRNKIKATPIGKAISKLNKQETLFVPSLPPGSNILEIGFGNAEFLKKFMHNSWNLYGVEINEEMVTLAKNEYGINAFCGDLEQAQYPSDFFDAVFGWHVIEHLYNPIETLVEIRRILKGNGYLIIGLPNIASWEFKVFGSNWYALQLPTHLFHFSPETIKLILLAAELREVNIIFQESINNIAMSIVFLLEKLLNRRLIKLRNYVKKSIIIRLLLKPIVFSMNSLSTSGRMLVVARK